MKLKYVTQTVVTLFDDEESDDPMYRSFRRSEDGQWEVLMGESWESAYTSEAELEAAYKVLDVQEPKVSIDHGPGILTVQVSGTPLEFTIEEMTTSGPNRYDGRRTGSINLLAIPSEPLFPSEDFTPGTEFALSDQRARVTSFESLPGMWRIEYAIIK